MATTKTGIMKPFYSEHTMNVMELVCIFVFFFCFGIYNNKFKTVKLFHTNSVYEGKLDMDSTNPTKIHRTARYINVIFLFFCFRFTANHL